MNEMKIFENEAFGEIRTLETDDGKALFCGADIANALGYSNPRKALADHCKGVTKCDTLTKGGKQSLSFIPEGDVYRLIAHSKLPNAVKFESWVFDEVLPTIRKNGAYALRDSYQIEDPIERAKRWIEEQQEKKQLQLTVSVQNQQIAELQPKASYYDVVLNCKDLMSITEIAKDYGKSAKWMNNYLHERGIQFKQAGIWLLYAKYADKWYTSTKTQTYNGYDGTVHSKVHTYWTQAGRLFLYDLLKADGILPIVERAA